MSGIAGLRGTGDWGTDERPKNFRESILFYSPNGNAPIFALSSKAGKKTVNDPEYAWWAEPNTLFRLQASGAHAAGDTTITVDSVDPTATTMNALYGTAIDSVDRTATTINALYGTAILKSGRRAMKAVRTEPSAARATARERT